MSSPGVNLERALGGEVNRIYSELIDEDLRGILNSEEYILYLELVEHIKRKGKYESLKPRLEGMRRRIIAGQYDLMGRQLMDDISKMSRVVGHRESSGPPRNPIDKWMEG